MNIKFSTEELTFILNPQKKRVTQHFEVINQSNETRIFKFKVTNTNRYILHPVISQLEPLDRIRIEILCDMSKFMAEKPQIIRYTDKLGLFSLPCPENFESIDKNQFIKDNKQMAEQINMLLLIKIEQDEKKKEPEFQELPKDQKPTLENATQELTESVIDPSFNRFESIIPFQQKEVLTTSVAKGVILEDQTSKQSIEVPRDEGDVVLQLKRRIFVLENQLKESSVGL